MNVRFLLMGISTLLLIFAVSCSDEEIPTGGDIIGENPIDAPSVEQTFAGRIDLEALANYANQGIPNYINRDNTAGNPITNSGATLGRVLFYDKALSVNNTISCGSCHKQEFAFGDDARASLGVDGTTGRHSMRLVNARFSDESRFFWDERANTLETQTTMPIQDHIEMGFSGQNGDPDLDDLIQKLEGIAYYQELFTFVYSDENITETRMQLALAQFIRSIQSFDSKYDAGRAQANNNGGNFANFTAEENRGKNLFQGGPQFNNAGLRVGGGLGCGACHQAPEFGIRDNSGNNGITGTVTDEGTDFTVTKSPSLRDLLNRQGQANGPFMHNGFSSDLIAVINHYDQIPNENIPGLDRRLRPNGNPQNLAMTLAEKDAVVAFLETLTGNQVYTDAKWSDPFQ